MSAHDNGLRQEIATHLEVEDRILFGLTLRQAIIVLVGLSIGYSVYAQLEHLAWPFGAAGAHPPQVVCVVVGIIPALGALAFALIEIGGRPTEEWALALIRYAALPKRYAWRVPPSHLAITTLTDGATAASATPTTGLTDAAGFALVVTASLFEEGDDL